MSLHSPDRRQIRLCYYNQWAGPLEETAEFLRGMAGTDLRPRVAAPADEGLLKKAALDFAWYGENARCFASLAHADIDFLPAWTVGSVAILEVAKRPREHGEERWLLCMGQQPQNLGASAGPVFSLLQRSGVRIFYYSFDEASRRMPCFTAIAPHLDVLVHDESPMAEAGQAKLSLQCLRLHRSWVANVVPFAYPLREEPERKIVFLGSQLGLTPHRRRQIDFLQKRFPDEFVSLHDHSLAVADRGTLAQYLVSFCPEGRMFSGAAMGATHTDRPFWTGCLGMAVVSENSSAGNRLPELVAGRYLESYRHGDLAELEAACKRALAWDRERRRRAHDYFNREETVGAVVARLIAEAPPLGTSRAM